MLRIKLFGSGRAEYHDKQLDDFPNQIVYLLLCYFLLNKRYPIHRERVAAVFWGNYPTRIARKYFRNALWRLRIALQSMGLSLDQYLLINDDSVSFITSSAYWLDIEVFEDTINQFGHLPVEQLLPYQVHRLEETVGLYEGDLLETVYDDWCLYDRERLRLMYINQLGRLMEYYEQQNDFEKSLLYGKQILLLDPTRENVHRQIMWLYWQNQDRNAALAQYKILCQILSSELDIQPMESTRLLYENMLHNQISYEQKNQFGQQQEQWKDFASGIQPIAEYALQKLQHLQETIIQTNLELHQIEQMINKIANSTVH